MKIIYAPALVGKIRDAIRAADERCLRIEKIQLSEVEWEALFQELRAGDYLIPSLDYSPWLTGKATLFGVSLERVCERY